MFTVENVTKGCLHLMREYSNSGQIITTSDNKDYILSVIPLLNKYQIELASTSHKLKRKFEISHNMPTNQLGLINWNEDKVHIGGVDDIYSSQGVQAFSIMASGRFSYVVQEEIAGVWTTIDSYTHTPTTGEGDVNKKKKLTLTNVTNIVRIVFNSAYRHPFKWVALFSDNFYDDSDVPIFNPFVPYTLPSNYYMTDKVEFSHADRQLNDYSAYKINYTDTTKEILLNWYEKGEFIVRYFAYPAIISDPDPNNPTNLNSTVIELPDECYPLLITGIASDLLRDENAYISDTLAQQYQMNKSELNNTTNYEQGAQGVISNSNW